MSYASFLKNVPEILSQPTGIAALASLGIHGAIAFILPLMPVESTKSNKQATTTTKPVGLSELSSSEQSRIPQPLQTNQPGVQSQLPPLPSQIAGLPAQQQIPLIVPGASSTTLPPSPPIGSTGSLVPPRGSNSSAFTPLERASGLSIAGLPRGGNPVQRFRSDLKFDPSRYGSTPTISSRVTPGFSSGTNRSYTNRNYNSDLGYSRQPQIASRPERLAELPSTAPTNLPVYPPALPAGDMATPPIGNTGENYSNINAAQPGSDVRVEPNGQYIAPVVQNQTPGNGNFRIATGGTPLPSYQPQSGGVVDNLNRPSNTPGVSVAPTGSTTQPGNTQQNSPQNSNDVLADARIFGDFKKEFPQGELRTPINLTMDETKLDRNVKVSLVMDGENKIADFKLSGDAAKLPFKSQQAIRERLQEYFKENPTSTNGKGALFSFTLLPGSQVNNTASQNNQTPQTAPQATNNSIMNRLTGTQPNGSQPVTVPGVNNTVVNSPINNPISNTNRTTNSNQLPVLPPPLPGALKPVGGALPQGQQTVLPKLPLQKPATSTDLPQTLRNVQPAPQVKPSIQNSETQSIKTPSQPTRNALVDKLRNTQSSEEKSEMSVVEKLRKVRQQRENANRENANP